MPSAPRPAPAAGACRASARIVGRERNLLRRPDGQRYWPKLDVEGYREVAPVVEHQLLQREIDLLEMKLVVEQPLTSKQEKDLAAVVNDAIGYPFRIQFTYFDGEIPRSASGKFEEFLCLLPDDALTALRSDRTILFRHPGESRRSRGKRQAPSLWPLDSGFRRNDERGKTPGLSLSSPAR